MLINRFTNSNAMWIDSQLYPGEEHETAASVIPYQRAPGGISACPTFLTMGDFIDQMEGTQMTSANIRSLLMTDHSRYGTINGGHRREAKKLIRNTHPKFYK